MQIILKIQSIVMIEVFLRLQVCLELLTLMKVMEPTIHYIYYIK